MAADISVIPKPSDVVMGDGVFRVGPKTAIYSGSIGAESVADYLAGEMRTPTGYRLPVRMGARVPEGSVLLQQVDDPALGEEGYGLRVGRKNVTLYAHRPAGLTMGVQTIMQMLPPEIESRGTVHGMQWNAPTLHIRDVPSYGWRGVLLDSGRHFFPPETVKGFVDYMARYKLNVLHWHLTEDQGWRPEIRGHPEIVEMGAWRNHGNQHGSIRYGGFYTQDEMRDVVAYASQRGVTVMPEIDLPGHMQALLASHPELSCMPGRKYGVSTKFGIRKDVLCAGNPGVLDFMGNVFSELSGVFDSKYIHIGGDEVPRDRWSNCPKCQGAIAEYGLGSEDGLQVYFMRQVQRLLGEMGRDVVCWGDELNKVPEGSGLGLGPGAIIHVWNSLAEAGKAAELGLDIIGSHHERCYFDYPAAVTDLRDAYSVDFSGDLPEQLRGRVNVRGGECCLWSERIPDAKTLYYQANPRALAFAERAWSGPGAGEFSDFYSRAGRQRQRLAEAGLNCGPFLRENAAVTAKQRREFPWLFDGQAV